VEQSNSQTFPHFLQSKEFLVFPRIIIITTPAVPGAAGEALTKATTGQPFSRLSTKTNDSVLQSKSNSSLL